MAEPMDARLADTLGLLAIDGDVRELELPVALLVDRHPGEVALATSPAGV